MTQHPAGTTERAYEQLAALRGRLPALRAALVPGTPRRWAQRDLTADQRTRLDALAVAEREAKTANITAGITVIGDGRAPLDMTSSPSWPTSRCRWPNWREPSPTGSA
ncbi:hypothetical protein DQ384_21875 [Sphaerisporangium album]|uniref:DUF222 domain-containing protein n=1 Tax=Sphaerisporangium album TaxID=509200 RepID=A0A367FFA9_9ACTN|nr:hypothetical protein [Sphaerisporangium album]RCG29004.1 hypothetical protein DQ384_21875 [Sphaerisporangium album]